MTLHEQAADLIIKMSERRPLPDADIWCDIDELARKLAKKPEPPTEAECFLFDEFRKHYKKNGGSVRGMEMELKCLVKHKDWRDALVDLNINHERQVRERKAMADAGKMVPEWPHLQTYLNQRRWEMVYYHTVSNAAVEDSQYHSWLRKQKYNIPYDQVRLSALAQQQVDAFKRGTGMFDGLYTIYSQDQKETVFAALHSEYFNNSYLRTKYSNIATFIKSKIKEQLT